MKTWKKWSFVAIIAFFGIVIGFTACDNGNNTFEQPKQYDDFYGLEDRGERGVKKSDVDKIIGDLETIYGTWDPELDIKVFENKINEVRINNGNALSKNGTVLNIGHNVDKLDLVGYMEDIRIGLI
jgi:hypothetical protein